MLVASVAHSIGTSSSTWPNRSHPDAGCIFDGEHQSQKNVELLEQIQMLRTDQWFGCQHGDDDGTEDSQTDQSVQPGVS